jgi:uncharacterized protein (UPF0276 family)
VVGLDDNAVGLGFRPALAGDLLQTPIAVDFVEVVAEACLVSAAAEREARALADVWPVVPHGVKLSLGSADGVDDDKARRLGALARSLRAPVVSEHAAFTTAAGVEIGHLTQLPRTRAAIAALRNNVDRVRRHFSMPLLLENVAWTWRWPDDEMSEADFYAEVVAATGCDLLLDLGNLRANALNEGRDPLAVLDAFPLERVAMVHIAGGVVVDDFFYDNHAAPVPDGVFALLARLVATVGPRPVLLERDGAFPPFAELRSELDRARATLATGATPHPPRSAPHHTPAAIDPTPTTTTSALAAAQATLARRLTAPALDATDVPPAERPALERARAVLARKRVDDALPLLAHLARRGETIAALATTALEQAPRPARRVAPADAVRIAKAALAAGCFVDDARRDLLHLRARFRGVEDDDRGPVTLVPRVAPFVGGERLDDGRRCVVLKGPGHGAALHHLERQPTP